MREIRFRIRVAPKSSPEPVGADLSLEQAAQLMELNASELYARSRLAGHISMGADDNEQWEAWAMDVIHSGFSEWR